MVNFNKQQLFFVYGFIWHFPINIFNMLTLRIFIFSLKLANRFPYYYAVINVKPHPPRCGRCRALGGDLILEFCLRVGEFDQKFFVLNSRSFHLHALICSLGGVGLSIDNCINIHIKKVGCSYWIKDIRSSTEQQFVLPMSSDSLTQVTFACGTNDWMVWAGWSFRGDNKTYQLPRWSIFRTRYGPPLLTFLQPSF